MTFTLHEKLAADSVVLTDLPLCRALLMDDSRWPWVILVPRQPDLSELHALSNADQSQLMREISLVSRVLERTAAPDKLNVGALGNVVPQLHIHVVARRRDDEAWPGPVWGAGQPRPHGERLAETRDRLARALEDAAADNGGPP